MSPRRSTVPVLDGNAGAILVADDDAMNRKLLRDILEAQGHHVTVAEDGQQALESALADPPNAVLLDVMMPKLDGYEVCAQLRQDARTAHLPILMITALKDRNDRLKGIRAGANDFLTKPIDTDEISLRVRNAVLASRLHDRVQADYARLVELERLRDNLTNMIVHDMRSPLLGISLSFEILLMAPERSRHDPRQIISSGQDACTELTDMVASLLDVSRMEAGQMPLHRVASDVRDLAQKAVESVTVLAQKTALVLSVVGGSASAEVDGDILHRVLVNLLGNAIKYSPRSGTVVVGITSSGESVRVTVTDQGHGIPPESHARIFEKFGQVGPLGANQKYSTGLGLTFCKLAVEAHGGEIGVDSQAEHGSTFWFSLPRRKIQQPRTKADDPSKATHPAGG